MALLPFANLEFFPVSNWEDKRDALSACAQLFGAAHRIATTDELFYSIKKSFDKLCGDDQSLSIQIQHELTDGFFLSIGFIDFSGNCLPATKFLHRHLVQFIGKIRPRLVFSYTTAPSFSEPDWMQSPIWHLGTASSLLLSALHNPLFGLDLCIEDIIFIHSLLGDSGYENIVVCLDGQRMSTLVIDNTPMLFQLCKTQEDKVRLQNILRRSKGEHQIFEAR